MERHGHAKQLVVLFGAAGIGTRDGWGANAEYRTTRVSLAVNGQQSCEEQGGESKWRPLELCYWLDQAALPAKGKEYPGLGYKRLRDMPPKA
ncbi:hypothetical protein QJQ45_008495 [Haematococcus lacustris]|nr:hypothetical protein QJQ45_008495 [Haematococcus lacustris]